MMLYENFVYYAGFLWTEFYISSMSCNVNNNKPIYYS